MKKFVLMAVLFAACEVAHGQCNSGGVGVIGGVGVWQCGLGIIITGLENSYCTKGSGSEQTEGTPLWGATDDLATLPTKCMYTGLDATPSPGNIYTPASTATLLNVINSPGSGPAVNSDGTTSGSPTMHMGCGDAIVLAAGTTYVGEYALPALSCDGQHWVTIKTSGATNPNFPAEGIRATPCIAGLANDAIHNGGVRQVPGYPDYICTSYPTVLSAKIQQGNSGPAISFVTLGNHYRFIGIEITKNPAKNIGQIVDMAADGLTLGTNHVIFDRSLIHGDQWTPSSSPTNESQNGINAKNSQWIGLINSWVYDTYCNASCIDSHDYGAGTGFYQDGPHKLYNNFLATAGESFFFGGGGVGPGTPNTANAEVRSNHSFKPLTWMVPINTCNDYFQAITKNLGELKNLTLSLIEGNVFENSWQGCQSDQNGTAFKWNPTNQNNHQSMHVDADGSNVVNSALQCSSGSNSGNSCTNDTQCPSSTCGRKSFTHHNLSSPVAGDPIDAANCPPGGCILDDVTNNLNYRFCDGANGCDQSGIPNQQCGTTTPQGSIAGTACTSNAQCPGSYCAPTITARITQPVPAATFLNVNGCVPGDNPGAKNVDITFRYNEIYNVTGGISVNTGLDSICRDQSAGMKNISIHDNELHGLSREMSNGVDPYSDATCFTLSNNSLPPSVVNTVGIRHNTCAVETGNPNGSGSFGNQVDHSDIQYMQGVAITDNVAPAAYGISRGNGTGVTKGIGGNFGLANTYAVNSCQRYFTVEIPDGTVVTPIQDFTFAGLPSGGTNYLVSLNGQYTALATFPAPTATSFTVTAAVHAGDSIVVRDLNDCDWTFASNVMGTGAAVGFDGFGKDQSPYPNLISGVLSPYQCGGSGALSCLLTGSSFVNLFSNWDHGRNGNYTIVAPNFVGTASDRLSRAATGQSPGADLTLVAAKTAGVRGTANIPALTVTTSVLPGGTHGIAYNAQLQASFGASQFWNGFKLWFLETDPANCGGSCGTLGSSGLVIARNGVVNGPLPILNVSRAGCPAACLSTYTEDMTILIPSAWSVGQIASLAQFADCVTGCTGLNTQDSSFNGVCTITALTTNGFSCRQAGDIAGTNSNKASHNPYSPKTCGISGTNFCDSIVSFAPVTVGTYTFWVGAKDGAFQVARKQITVTIN